MVAVASFACGLIFGIGLLISGMTDPQKVLGFLDVLGPWDPTLAFVMAGALGVTAIGFTVAKRRGHPMLESREPVAGACSHRCAFGRRCYTVWHRMGSGGIVPRTRDRQSRHRVRARLPLRYCHAGWHGVAKALARANSFNRLSTDPGRYRGG